MPGKIPKDKYINIDTISQDIDNCIIEYCDKYGINLNDYNMRVNIKHNEVNNMLRYVYKCLFKPNITLPNNQKSYVDYENIDLLQVLADKFIDICMMFNKSLGLMSFALLVGCDYATIYLWMQDNGKSNPLRFKLLKNIQENHKNQHIALLNDTPVGALAVANNDIETGLEWSKQQAIQSASNTVYLIPSERLDKLKLPGTTKTGLDVSTNHD